MDLYYLDFNMPDTHGFIPNPGMIGQTLTHTKRYQQFTITGFAWLGATDEWGFEHRLIGDHGPTITRPLRDLAGTRDTGEPRYQEQSDYYHYHVHVDDESETSAPG